MSMIIFLYGQDTYQSRQKLNEIVEHFKKIHKSGLNLKSFNLQEASFKDFKDEIQQSSMFKGKKLIVLTNVFSNADFKEKFKKDAQFFKEVKDIILFYENKKILESDKFALFLKKQGEFQKFELMEKQKLKDWIKQEFRKQETEIGEFALNLLIDFTGNDAWRLSNEIKKLCLFKKEKDKIEIQDVKILVNPKIETDIFKTIDAIAQKNKKQALLLIHQHLEKDDSVFYLLSMINFLFRNLIMVKSYGLPSNSLAISKATGMHPFVIKKTINSAERFSMEELKKAFQKLFETDLNIKSGKIDPEAGLKALIIDI